MACPVFLFAVMMWGDLIIPRISLMILTMLILKNLIMTQSRIRSQGFRSLRSLVASRCLLFPSACAWKTSARTLDVWRRSGAALPLKYLKLRYRLLPYIYSQAVKCTQTGLPMVRPMLLEFQDDRNTQKLDLQYMFGESFLVAPC